MEQIYKNQIYSTQPTHQKPISCTTPIKGRNHKSILEKFLLEQQQSDERFVRPPEKLNSSLSFRYDKTPSKGINTIFKEKDNKEAENHIQKKHYLKKSSMPPTKYQDNNLTNLYKTNNFLEEVSSTHVEKELSSFKHENNSQNFLIGDTETNSKQGTGGGLEKNDKDKDEGTETVQDLTIKQKLFTENEDEKIDRLLKMIEIDYKASQSLNLDTLDTNNMNTALASTAYMDSSSIDPLQFDCFQKCNYCVYFIFITAFILLTFLRATAKIFEGMKVWFDNIIIFCWHNLQNARGSSDFNILVLILLTPIFIILVVTYIGFCFVYVLNKLLLLKIPNSVVKQLNLSM